MSPVTRLLRGAAALFLVCTLPIAPTAQAQSLKGANWLRTDHAYNNVPASDPRRVAWNLEIAQDIPAMANWPSSYYTLHTQYQIKTLVRIGYSSRPTAAERTALAGASFTCSQINTLMGALDSEAANVPSSRLSAIGAFILGNEPNLPDIEWGVDGRGYGRVHSCYMTRWNNNSTLAAKPLLAAGPGGCHIYDCPGFWTGMLANMGSVVDGFAIHAYGRTANDFDAGFRDQTTRINSAGNTNARNKPVYITEFNAGASPGTALPVAPTAAYFNEVLGKAASFNASNGNQIKAVMYFVDSPDPWVRGGGQCHPSVPTPPTSGWWQTSLCYRGAWRQYWLDSQPPAAPPAPDAASLTLSGIPAFMLPGEIRRFSVAARNTGSGTWSGSGASNMVRLGANGANGFIFSAFPQCGGYWTNNLNARVYTCGNVAPNVTNTYSVDVRAPVIASSATFQAKMVRDGVAWFGNAPSQAVAIGAANCGTAVTQCILAVRTDILPFYQANGWSTACSNRNAIVSNWCGIAPGDCNALRTGSGQCARFNNSSRCPDGRHRDGTLIDVNTTYYGYQVCGTDGKIYSCGTGSGGANAWHNTGTNCN